MQPICIACSCLLLVASASAEPYDPAPEPTRVLSAGELAIKVLVEEAGFGSSELEIGEITFPADYEARGHSHGATEIFYVLEGRMNHIVNGVEHVLEPGDIGIVRPPDTVSHGVLDGKPVRALVIWAPGGEVERLRGAFPNETILAATDALQLSRSKRSDAEITELWVRSCALCHIDGSGGAPVVGKPEDWAERFAGGLESMLENTIQGMNNMPPLGYCMSCERDDFERLIEFMTKSSAPGES